MLGLIDTNWVVLAMAMGIPAFVLVAVVVGMKAKRMLGLIALILVVVGAGIGVGVAYAFRPPPSVRGGGSSSTAAGGNGSVGSSPSAPSGRSNCSPNGTSLHEAAQNVAYTAPCLAAPANSAFTIAFDNKDGVAHSIHIYTADPGKGGTSVFQGDIFSGPATKTYSVQALKPGTYYFHCDVHPTTMIGTLIVR